MTRYTVTQSAVTQLLADVHSDKIAIPELQRPFVWDSVKVRDLMDSLYKGYPVGYLITWHSVGAALKGGQVAAHQQILIDGQQRITALRAAVAGLKVVDKRYRQVRIKIAFNPVSISDHFQPWQHQGGHAPFSIAWLAAVAERVLLGTSVMTPTFRYNPAVIAQAFASLGCL